MDNFTIFNTSIKCGMQTICSLAGRNSVNLSMQIDNINNMSEYKTQYRTDDII